LEDNVKKAVNDKNICFCVPLVPYSIDFGTKNRSLSCENMVLEGFLREKSIG